MAETPSSAELREQLRASADRLELALGHGEEGLAAGVDPLDALVRAALATVTALEASLGECRLETPYVPLRPIIDSEGAFGWTCTHSPEHRRP
jgi:hypothetical protein